MLVSVILFQQYFITTMARESGKLEVRSFHNEILYGYSYRNFTTSSMQECLQHCISDCLCQSFQICENTCELCSTTKRLTPDAVQEKIGCNRFEFENRNDAYVSLECLEVITLITTYVDVRGFAWG